MLYVNKASKKDARNNSAIASDSSRLSDCPPRPPPQAVSLASAGPTACCDPNLAMKSAANNTHAQRKPQTVYLLNGMRAQKATGLEPIRQTWAYWAAPENGVRRAGPSCLEPHVPRLFRDASQLSAARARAPCPRARPTTCQRLTSRTIENPPKHVPELLWHLPRQRPGCEHRLATIRRLVLLDRCTGIEESKSGATALETKERRTAADLANKANNSCRQLHLWSNMMRWRVATFSGGKHG